MRGSLGGGVVLVAEHVRVARGARGGWSGRAKGVEVLSDVSLTLTKGETLGVLGESGCGKSTLARALCGLLPVRAGSVRYFGGCNNQDGGVIPPVLGIQMVFQDPLSSLNPRRSVLHAVTEGWQINRGLVPRERWRRVAVEVVNDVGLGEKVLRRYPSQLSGGERQRIALARALSVEPSVIVCDEAVSALDVSVKAQILELLRAVQVSRGTSYVFISHDTESVRAVSDRVMVMYLGEVVESGDVEDVFSRPKHPYTVMLLSAAPRITPWRSAKVAVRLPVVGEPVSFSRLPGGCRFRTRCPMAAAICAEKVPELRHVGQGWWVACHFATVAPTDDKMAGTTFGQSDASL